jgi:hypothetical protein
MNATPQKRGRVALIGVAILGLAAGAVALGFRSATAADDHGNTNATATPVAIGAPVLGTLDSYADKDWFVVQSVPQGPLHVVASGQAFVPHVDVFDSRMRIVARMPGAGTLMQGPFQYSSPLPRIRDSRLYLLVAPAGKVGSYSIVVATETGGPIDPVPPADGPIDPVPPPVPPAPPSPTDDVPAGTEHDFTVAGFFEGNIEIPGDTDTLLFVAPEDGTYEFRLTSAMPDAIGDALPPHTFHVQSWVVEPTVEALTAGTQVRVTVHSLSEQFGAYRLQAALPGASTPPAPPPPVPPLPTGPDPTDVLLPFDPVAGMAPKPARDYQAWLNQRYRFTDPTVNGEAVDALALRDRWIQIDNGSPGLRVMYQDPTGAIGSALAPFGGPGSARTRFPAWIRTQSGRMVVGGGTLAQIRTLVVGAVGARRPLLLLGRREGSGLVEAWVVFGIRTVGGVQNLVVLDPSMPGQTLNLPLGPAGLLPVSSGGVLIKNFTFQGSGADVIYP